MPPVRPKRATLAGFQAGDKQNTKYTIDAKNDACVMRYLLSCGCVVILRGSGVTEINWQPKQQVTVSAGTQRRVLRVPAPPRAASQIQA